MSQARLSACMLIYHKGHDNTIQVYSVTVMTNVKALEAGQSSQGHLSLLHRNNLARGHLSLLHRASVNMLFK